jgi:hypothetical protein
VLCADSACFSRANDAWREKFADVSLQLPWPLQKTQCLCGFQSGKFSYGKKYPVKFPAQGISLVARETSAKTKMETHNASPFVTGLQRMRRF